jgi:hypothetical protein
MKIAAARDRSAGPAFSNRHAADRPPGQDVTPKPIYHRDQEIKAVRLN